MGCEKMLIDLKLCMNFNVIFILEVKKVISSSLLIWTERISKTRSPYWLIKGKTNKRYGDGCEIGYPEEEKQYFLYFGNHFGKEFEKWKFSAKVRLCRYLMFHKTKKLGWNGDRRSDREWFLWGLNKKPPATI